MEYKEHDKDNNDMDIGIYLIKKIERKTFLHTLLEYLPLFFYISVILSLLFVEFKFKMYTQHQNRIY